MNELSGNIIAAVKEIKTAIVKAQACVTANANAELLMLYFGIGQYVSHKTKTEKWGTGVIDAISRQLQEEMPGLRGFTSRNLRYMRTFYEAWEMLDFAGRHEKASENVSSSLELTNSKFDTAIVPIWNLQVPNYPDFPKDAGSGIV